MFVDNHLTAVEDAVRLLLLASCQSNPSPFHNPFPQKVSKDETIPILTEIDSNLQRLQDLLELLIQVKGHLAQWRGQTNCARPIGTLPVEMLSNIFSRIYDNARNSDRPCIALQLSHVNLSWREICLAQGTLWTDIDAEWTYGRQDVWLERSKLQPLRIFSEADKFSLSPRLRREVDRIHAITSWVGEGKDLQHPFPSFYPFRALRCIDLDTSNCDDIYPMEESIYFAMPNLQHVTLNSVSFDIDDFPPLPWTHLDISRCDGSCKQWLVKLLRACPRLHTFAIHGTHFDIREMWEVETLQLDGTPSLFPRLKELYIETRDSERDYIIRLFSRFIVAPALVLLRIIVKDAHNPNLQWHTLLDIRCLLDHSPLLETLEIFDSPTRLCAIIRDLAPHRHSLPNLRKLSVDCKVGFEEKWSAIKELVAAWAVFVGTTATDVIEELDLLNAPTEWREQTIPHVGLLRSTQTTKSPIDLFRSENPWN